MERLSPYAYPARITRRTTSRVETIFNDGAGLDISIVSLEDLKALKQYANRIGDQVDLEFITKLERRNHTP